MNDKTIKEKTKLWFTAYKKFNEYITNKKLDWQTKYDIIFSELYNDLTSGPIKLNWYSDSSYEDDLLSLSLAVEGIYDQMLEIAKIERLDELEEN